MIGLSGTGSSIVWRYFQTRAPKRIQKREKGQKHYHSLPLKHTQKILRLHNREKYENALYDTVKNNFVLLQIAVILYNLYHRLKASSE